MAEDSAPVFTLQRADRWAGGPNFDVGAVRVGSDGLLEVVSAEPDYETYLTEVVDTVNATDELTVKVPPPADAEPYSVYYRIADRTSPDLIDVLRTYLERDFDLLLAAEPSD